MPKNLEVVVIDPDVNSRADTNRALVMAHFEVSGEAGYGIDAVTMAREKNPDIIVLAMEEPVARASQTMGSLSDALPETPIIVYSSLSDAASVRRAMVSGARDYLVKPPRPEELARAIYSVLEQEERRRTRLTGDTASSAARGTVITVFGAKGGIGKTTISTNLATALCPNTNSAITIIDMDTRFGDVAIMMDVVVEYSIADVGRAIDSVDRDTIREYLVQHSSGVQILPAPLHPTEWGALHRHHIARVIELLAQTHDYVVVDTPGAFNELVGDRPGVRRHHPAGHQHGHRQYQRHRVGTRNVARCRCVRGQSQAGDQPLDFVHQPATRGCRARPRVRGVLAHSARCGR